MQETPNFHTYLSRFQNADKATVLDSREIISGADRRFLESVYERFELYFNDNNFRAQLSLQTRNQIENSYIPNILSYLENIASWQRDGSTPIAGANLQNQIQNITDQVTAFDQQIAGYYFTYLSTTDPLGERVRTINSLVLNAEQESQSLNEVIENVKSQVNDRKQNYDATVSGLEGEASETFKSQTENGREILGNIETILTQAKLLIGRASGHQLGDYYHRLANGRTISENDSYIKEKGKATERLLNNIQLKKWLIYAFSTIILAYLTAMYITYNPLTLNIWTSTFFIILSIGVLIYAIACFTVLGLRQFNSRYKGGHERTAILWMVGAITSTLATALYASILIRQLTANGSITWEEIIPKIIVLIAPAYLVRLCIQNYRANAHLAVQYMHRATIMSIAQNYSNATAVDATQNNNSELLRISHEAKMMILTDAAKIMFAQSESGYITQKEGAGSNGDNMIDSLRGNIK